MTSIVEGDASRDDTHRDVYSVGRSRRPGVQDETHESVGMLAEVNRLHHQVLWLVVLSPDLT